jgi:hypothetical protein
LAGVNERLSTFQSSFGEYGTHPQLLEFPIDNAASDQLCNHASTPLSTLGNSEDSNTFSADFATHRPTYLE